MAKKSPDIREKIKSTYTSLVRVKAAGWIVGFAAVIIASRLFYLQLIRGGYYKKLADANAITGVVEQAPRGEIFDRNYKKLVTNSPSYKVSIIPYSFRKNQDSKKAVREIALILRAEPSEIEKKLGGIMQEKLLEPVTIRRDITMEQVSRLTEKALEISGLAVTQEPKRSYPYGALASHVIGYTGEITENQIKLKKYEKYKGGDIIGQTGIESWYDADLRGSDGLLYIQTDARGRQKKVTGTLDPEMGKNVVLTIDYRLQRFAEQRLADTGFNGVVIAVNPKNGEILSMVSKPDFDLNYFSGKVNVKEWKRLVRDPGKPLTNRAIQGLYSPGSIFKVAVGLGALNEGIIGLDDVFFCDGIYWIKTWPYKCWKRTGHGWVSFNKAVEQSCDIYFYKVGLKLKVESIYKYAVMFGLGERTGVDIPGEKSGLVPSREWKMRIAHSPWFPGNTVMMSIGQGYIISTPLQILDMICVMANGGYCMKPHIVRAITKKDRRIDRQIKQDLLFELKGVSKENIETMQRALRMVVKSVGGTGKKAGSRSVEVAGKTGTVENQQGEPHAMFAGYAPYNDPQIAVYVLIEHGGGGGDMAAPVAGDVIEYYLTNLKEADSGN